MNWSTFTRWLSFDEASVGGPPPADSYTKRFAPDRGLQWVILEGVLEGPFIAGSHVNLIHEFGRSTGKVTSEYQNRGIYHAEMENVTMHPLIGCVSHEAPASGDFAIHGKKSHWCPYPDGMALQILGLTTPGSTLYHRYRVIEVPLEVDISSLL